METPRILFDKEKMRPGMLALGTDENKSHCFKRLSLEFEFCYM
jgi:hypothetical protein